MKRAALLLLLLLPLVWAARSSAQSAGSINADAVVVTVGMTVATLRDLDFGSVVKGATTIVAPTAGTAGAWQVSGNPNAFVVISFTLPTLLTNIQALPGSTMPISFDATSARWNRANNNAAAGTPFDPAAGAVGRLGPPPNPSLYIWLGGTVNPALTAKPGIYRANVIVSLIYQ